jgi:putative CocE/NonD family hydrolase
VVRNRPPARDRPWRRSGALRYALNRIRGIARPPVTVTDAPDHLHADRDVVVATRDGTILRINVFGPGRDNAAPRPVILSIHPYGKDDLPTRRGGKTTFSRQYRVIRQPQPVAFSTLTGWEAPDPVWWTAHGFVVVNADSRGCGHSDGTGNLLSHQEAEDTYDLVQWIAAQPWCDGNVVMLGVSYLAISQYAVAALRPPALRAICPWEGFTDAYRDLMFPGGVQETGFSQLWSRNLSRATRQSYDLARMQDDHPLRDQFWRSLAPDLSAIKVPMLVCGSFSDNNLHSRGSVRAFVHGGSDHARLYTHRGGKWTTFYSDAALAEQLKFFREVLDGTPARRSVRLEVREDRDTVTAVREEVEWPLARTHWRPLYLGEAGTLTPEPPAAAGRNSFETRSTAASFTWTATEDIELTGPMAARLWVELSGCDDANLFVGVEKWRNGRFVGFEGSYGYGRDRVTTGWQRVALRALDPQLSRPAEPVISGTDPRPVSAGEIAVVEVALGPSATLFRAGEQLRLVVAGRWLAPKNPLTGQFPARYAASPRGRITLHWGPRRHAHLLVPEIPG